MYQKINGRSFVMSIYVDVNNLNIDLYSEYEQGFVRPFMGSEVKFKECKKCKKAFPLTDVFFSKEKRINDGFENSCKICRGSGFKYTNRVIVSPKVNKELTSKIMNNTEYYEHYINTNEIPYRTFIKDNHKEILIYLIEAKYCLSDEEIVSISRDWIKEHKLYGALLRQYKGNIIDLIESIYPERYKPWQFASVGVKYWNVKENRIKAIQWLIDKLLIDKIIESIDDLPNVVTTYTFADYGMSTLVGKYYNHSVYAAIEEVLPNKFNQWDYYYLPEKYWSNKNNRIAALKNLIEDKLGINVKDIPKVISYEFFRTHYRKDCKRFCGIINTYYDIKVLDYIEECYPNVFNVSDFYYKNHYPTLDGIVVRSEPERLIHHILINSGLDARYEDKECRFYNEEHDQGYRPDWSVRYGDKIIIVEYYGMLNMNDVDYGYDDKYEKKHKFYNELCKENEKYIYMPLYNEDIHIDITGLISKFNEIGIELKV